MNDPAPLPPTRAGIVLAGEPSAAARAGTLPAGPPAPLSPLELAGCAELRTALALRREAMSLAWAERWNDAQQQLAAALGLLEGRLTVGHPLVAATLQLAANAYRERGDATRARRHQDRARALLRDWEPPLGPTRALVLGWGAPNRLGRQPVIEVCFWPSRMALEDCRDAAIPVSDLGRLARFHHRRGWLGLAAILYRESIDRGVQELGPHHPQVTADRHRLAEVLATPP